jgi:hypothetical protein
MIKVRIVKSWQYPSLSRQTPNNDGAWGQVLITEEPLAECDYLVLLGPVSKEVEAICPPQNVWLILQEPPTEGFRAIHGGIPEVARIYTQDTSRRGRRFVHTQPALPWHVDKDYSYLQHAQIPPKTKQLSWITSNKSLLRGHRARMDFLDRLHENISLDLYGSGFNRIPDKWDGLAQYRYTLAVENFTGPYYFSEKLMDAWLSWTMPIYHGCTNITDYFPKGAFISLDIRRADAVEELRRIIESDAAERNMDAIREARDRVLNTYQLFPFLAAQISADIAQAGHLTSRPRSKVNIKPRKLLLRRVINKIRNTIRP